MNGSSAVYFAFNGLNADGVDRLVQVVYLFNETNQVQYVVNFVQDANSDFFTQEVGGAIINSITLG